MDSLVCQEKIILLQWETIFLRTALPERNTFVPVLLVLLPTPQRAKDRTVDALPLRPRTPPPHPAMYLQNACFEEESS